MAPQCPSRGGLVITAGTQDYYLRAFNTANDEEAWKARYAEQGDGGG